SPVRAFKSVNSSPLFIKRGKGAIIEDEDGNSFIDYLSSWGPLILGHLHAEVAEAIRECLNIGTSFGAPTERENILGAMIIDAVPSIEMVRLVNSGTEATMSAARLARAYTGRDKIVKFEGCYHGHGDMFLIKAGSGALTHGVPTSPGVTKNIVENTINATYNNLKSVEEIFESEGNSIAAVFVEPVAGNMGVVPPEPGFLEGLREITEKYQALLIFDEVITGFRLSYGGAQQLYSVMPDITCLGKIIGGGLPVGAYGGKEDVMKMLSPAGPVYQAGTLSGNPLAVSAGIATLKVLKRPGFYQELNNKAQYLAKGLKEMAKNAGADVHINRVESMLCCFFSKNKVVDFKTASASDTEKYTLFFRSMLEQGIYLAPAQFESTFISLAHTQDMLDKTIEAAGIAFKNAVRP
ncbi:MAG: glutamate-1-semialdehyde 2,1-aminomutase, partial [Peptococcaceae bacterium]|nr:glutamate-1-semialdehyde 2,1-aminomutase [Peptococcaceae bacterium]